MYYLLTKYGITIGIMIRNVFIKNKTTDTSWSDPSRHCVISLVIESLFNQKLKKDLYVFTGHFCFVSLFCWPRKNTKTAGSSEIPIAGRAN